MTLAEYQSAAARTCPSLGAIEIDMLHMRMGVISELGELTDAFKKHIAYGKTLDMVNVREEIADICWYLANEMRIKELPISFDFDSQGSNLVGSLTVHQAAQAICIGLTSAYLVVTEASNAQPYYEYFKALYEFCTILGIDFYTALDLNIAKLKARYPEKFTEEAALNRDLDAERVILESRFERLN